MKAIITNIDYCVEWSDFEDIVDLVLCEMDIIKNTNTTLTIERTQYEDYKVGDTIYISFCDADDEKVFKTKVINATEDEWVFEYIDTYSIEEYLDVFKETLPQEVVIELPDGDEEEDDYLDFITDKLSDKTGWLIYSYDYELVE